VIDFELDPQLLAARNAVRAFVTDVLIPAEQTDWPGHGLDDSFRSELQHEAKRAGVSSLPRPRRSCAGWDSTRASEPPSVSREKLDRYIPPAGFEPAFSCVKGGRGEPQVGVGSRYLPRSLGVCSPDRMATGQMTGVCASTALPRSVGAGLARSACQTLGMSVHGGERVTLSGDVSGEYVVVEKRDDGSLVVAPDTSVEATLARHRMEPATLEEFEAEFGPIQPADGEG